MHATEKVLQFDQLLLMRGQGLGHNKTPTTSAQALPAPVPDSFLFCQHQFHSADHHPSRHRHTCNLFVTCIAQI